MLSYQKLDVYQCAIGFLAVAAEIILKLADPELLQKGSQLIERVVSMLTKMIKF